MFASQERKCDLTTKKEEWTTLQVPQNLWKMYIDNCDEIAEINAQVELWVSPDFAGEQPSDYKLVENQEAINCNSGCVKRLRQR